MDKPKPIEEQIKAAIEAVQKRYPGAKVVRIRRPEKGESDASHPGQDNKD